MSPTYDVILIGLGGMGGAAAHRLSARGARVLGLEKRGPVHNRGSGHGGSRITRSHGGSRITRHPARPESATAAAGFSGHGFTSVPVVGEIVADPAPRGATEHPIELFDPRRLAAASA